MRRRPPLGSTVEHVTEDVSYGSRHVDRVQAALQRRRLRDDTIRAFVDAIDSTTSSALWLAEQLDQHPDDVRSAGGLRGLPIAVKGRHGLRGGQARALCAAGAVPIGLTSTPSGPGPQTWGHTDRGPTRNPRRTDLSPGGSSAGSAAAVAAGIVELATGSDGAGSSRIPAAWCGIFGFKPTASPAAVDGGVPAVPAPVARDPRYLRLWSDVVLGALPAAAPVRTAAWSCDLGFAAAELEHDVVDVARAAAERLVARLGLRWVERPVRLLDPGGAWACLRDPAADAGTIARARAVRATNHRRLAALFSEVDVLLTPTTPGRPHGHGGPGERMSVALTWAFNVSDRPALSIPAGFTSDGAPVGLQVVTRARADRVLLDIAASCPPATVAEPVLAPTAGPEDSG